MTILTSDEIRDSLATLSGWKVDAEGKSIHKHYRFADFVQALAFVNRLGEAAEAANHHPDLTLGWGYVGVTFTTHDSGGLSGKDLAMAKKADEVL